MPPLTLFWHAAPLPGETAATLRAPAPARSGAAQREAAGASRRAVAAPPDGVHSSLRISTHDLLENAMRTARDEALRIERQGRADGPRRDAPESRLARSLAAPQAQEKLLAGGVYKITTRTGATYCLKEPPDYNRGGLSEALRIASTCP